MKNNRRLKALLMGVFTVTSWASAQQFTQIGTSGWWRTNPTTPNIGRGVAIGNLTTTPYPAAFQIHGDLLPAGNQTPEVFRTNAPTTANTYWRMFQGGTTAGFERGQLFAVPGQEHFNINAPMGHLRLYTNSVERARMNENISTTINGSGSFKPGFLGLSPTGSLWATGPGPFSRLHLDDGTGLITNPYRPWMRNGISMTGNDDFMYVGQLYRAGFDESDAVIAWGDNQFAPAGPDHLRFLFIGDATDVEGTEVVRVTGGGFFGIGDFDAASVQPDERLDLLTGTARIRQLPSSTYLAPITDDDKVMVVRSDGRVNWRDAASLSSTDCDWAIDPATGNVLTAFWPGALAPSCPDATNNVGIGVSSPAAKLDVVKTVNQVVGDEIGVRSELQLGGDTKVAFEALNVRSGVENYGLRARVANADVNWGVVGATRSDLGVTSTANVGVYGSAEALGAPNGGDAQTCIGVWGYVKCSNASSRWAGMFDGDVMCLGQYQGSDAAFKTNVQSLSNATSMLMQVQPRTYDYVQGSLGAVAMPVGNHMGFIAQEVESVLPSLVKDVVRPTEYDSTGQIAQPSVTFKAVNYTEMIPLLVAALQEQNARIDQLQAQVARCCSTGGIGVDRSMDAAPGGMDLARETDLRIIPNPVAASTQLRYTLATEGRVRLEVSDAMGRVIEVLEEGQRTSGEFTYPWNTSGLAPGTYYCTLLVNGEPLVKRAVKLNER